NKTDEELAILKILDAVPVQRNKGIDGILKRNYKKTPIPVKIQKENESLDESLNYLLEASEKRGSILKILVKTQETNSLFDHNFDEFITHNVILLESYDFSVKKWMLENKIK